MPEPSSVECIDRKCADAALGTPGPADKPLSRSASRIGKRSIHNLDQFGIERSASKGHALSIAQVAGSAKLSLLQREILVFGSQLLQLWIGLRLHKRKLLWLGLGDQSFIENFERDVGIGRNNDRRG